MEAEADQATVVASWGPDHGGRVGAVAHVERERARPPEMAPVRRQSILRGTWRLRQSISLTLPLSQVDGGRCSARTASGGRRPGT